MIFSCENGWRGDYCLSKIRAAVAVGFIEHVVDRVKLKRLLQNVVGRASVPAGIDRQPSSLKLRRARQRPTLRQNGAVSFPIRPAVL